MNWPMAFMVSVPMLVLGFVVWVVLHYESKSESSRDRAATARSQTFWQNSPRKPEPPQSPIAPERIRRTSCTVVGCRIKRPHSHMMDFLKKLGGR